jgi:nucleotide-binding universal stress UspA family protein
MIKKILVPLDGSKLAECSLSYAKELATGLGVDEVDLVTVTHRTQGFRPEEDLSQPTGERLVPEGVCSIEESASKYLCRAAQEMEAAGVKVEKEVLCGNPAEEIIIFANIRKCDLIIMASHGWQGPSRLIHGSVAQKVYKGARSPVMMIRAQSCGNPDTKPNIK